MQEESSRFQSQTGSTGHFADTYQQIPVRRTGVSIPNGLHRPFRQLNEHLMLEDAPRFQSQTGSTGHFAFDWILHLNNFKSKFQSQTGSTGHFATQASQPSPNFSGRFNPKRAPQAISPSKKSGSPKRKSNVSIPNGLHRPFRL